MIEILVILLSVNLLQFSSAAGDKMNHIKGNLYLGDKNAAKDEKYLKEHGITAVVNCASSFESKYKDLKFIKLGLKDKSSQKLFPKLDEGYEFIKEHIKKGKVFVHCQAGRSRSGSMVIYYLMREEGWDYEKTLKYVKSKRPCVKPNSGFEKQLKEYYKKHLKHKSKKHKDKKKEERKEEEDED